MSRTEITGQREIDERKNHGTRSTLMARTYRQYNVPSDGNHSDASWLLLRRLHSRTPRNEQRYDDDAGSEQGRSEGDVRQGWQKHKRHSVSLMVPDIPKFVTPADLPHTPYPWSSAPYHFLSGPAVSHRTFRTDHTCLPP